MFSKIAILGLGQLGGSFALACRNAGIGEQIIGYDPITHHGQLLIMNEAIDDIAETPALAVKEADLIMLSAPLRAYPALAQAIAPHVKKTAVITDIGSVKQPMQDIAAVLNGIAIVPAHPIAGSEKAGAAVANGALFEEKLLIITPLESTPSHATERVRRLWEKLDSQVMELPVTIHDQIYAHVSHLPHLIAFVASSFLYRQGLRVGKDDMTLQKFLRISRSNPRMWTDIFIENRTAILPALAAYKSILGHFVKELREGENAPTDQDIKPVAARYLPRILAASLISTVSVYEQHAGASVRRFGAGGMRDIVAPAAEEPEIDIEEISKTAAIVALLIEGILPLFEEVERLMTLNEEPQLFAHLQAIEKEATALVS
ncbi:MAG: prephenate dehydrogenase/arogenate dehydrogenase family protein [Alphaproteobacteria bacterium]|nr:prephenate dehydrogenase/arogenate dehydrogenase family protein [Alphaproteobacteria bacterium]